MAYKLHYWPGLPGRGEFVRLALEFAGADYVTVAHGRDYDDVAPVRGALRGSGGQDSSQAVDVIPVVA